jgi:Mg2+/Co2+ transporter CorB
MTGALILSILAIAVLLLLSAFFSGSETALTASSRARIHHLAQRGNRRARTVDMLTDRSAPSCWATTW